MNPEPQRQPHAEAQRRRELQRDLDVIELNRISGTVINCAYRIHRHLGPGLLESAYETILSRLLEREGLRVQRQLSITFQFEDIVIEDAFRIDLLIEGAVVVELKSVEKVMKVHGKQVLTYLKLMNLQLGLLINFGDETLRDGIQRIANGL